MKKVLMVIAPEEFRDSEYLVPLAFFLQHGFEVKTASLTKKAKGSFGYAVVCDLLIDEVQAEDFDGIFFVGGAGCLIYKNNKKAQEITEVFLLLKLPVGAICAAPRNLLYWGLLQGKRCTGYDKNGDFAALCKEYGAIYTGNPVETDGLICTGTGPLTTELAALSFIALIA